MALNMTFLEGTELSPVFVSTHIDMLVWGCRMEYRKVFYKKV